jgi:WD40 repeat protein
MYTCRSDGFINFYNVTSYEMMKTIDAHEKFCKSLACDEEFLFSAGFDGLIKKWDLNTGKLQTTLKGIVCFFNCFRPRWRYLAHNFV